VTRESDPSRLGFGDKTTTFKKTSIRPMS